MASPLRDVKATHGTWPHSSSVYTKKLDFPDDKFTDDANISSTTGIPPNAVAASKALESSDNTSTNPIHPSTASHTAPAPGTSAPSTPPRGRTRTPATTTPQSLLKKSLSGANVRLFGRSNSPSPVSHHRRKLSFGLTRSKTRYPSIAPGRDPKATAAYEDVPNLDIVNRKLEMLKHTDNDSDDQEGVENTRLISVHLKESHDCKRLLMDAMQARSINRPEICRAHCIQIIHSAYADAETKVYAYNILSTLASKAQAMRFLDEAERLAEENVGERPELQKMEGIIKVLRRGVEERERMGSHEEKSAGQKGIETDWSMTKRQDAEDIDPARLEMPKPRLAVDLDPNKVTLMTEKVLEWANAVD